MKQKCACGYGVDPDRRKLCPHCGEKIVRKEPPPAEKIPVPKAEPVRDETPLPTVGPETHASIREKVGRAEQKIREDVAAKVFGKAKKK